MAEWVAVLAITQGSGVRHELPLVDLGSLGAAVGTMLGDRLLGGDNGEEAHLKLVDCDVRLVDVEHQLTRENGTRRVLGAVVEDDWRGFDIHVQGSSRLGLDLWAWFGAGLGAPLLRMVLVVALEDVHDERFLGPRGLLDRGGLLAVDWGEEWAGGVRVGRFVELGEWGRRHPDEGRE